MAPLPKRRRLVSTSDEEAHAIDINQASHRGDSLLRNILCILEDQSDLLAFSGIQFLRRKRYALLAILAILRPCSRRGAGKRLS